MVSNVKEDFQNLLYEVICVGQPRPGKYREMKRIEIRGGRCERKPRAFENTLVIIKTRICL